MNRYYLLNSLANNSLCSRTLSASIFARSGGFFITLSTSTQIVGNFAFDWIIFHLASTGTKNTFSAIYSSLSSGSEKSSCDNL